MLRFAERGHCVKEDNLGGVDCIFDHGSIGSFDFTDTVERTMYAELMNSFTKPGGRIVLSFFDYEHSEHPTVPFAVTEEEVTTLYKEHLAPHSCCKNIIIPNKLLKFMTCQKTHHFLCRLSATTHGR